MEDKKRMPEGVKVIKPAPYIELKFACSNRAFYKVQAAIFNHLISSGVENPYENISEKCDYEGDLERLIVYDKEEAKMIIEFYGLPYKDEYNHMTLNVVC